MIGRSLGRYEIIEKLGEGGMGAVWRARDTLLERDVALKTLPRDVQESPKIRSRFLREAKAASALQHPGIATVYDTGEIDGVLFITFQLIEGLTLRNLIDSGEVPVADARRLSIEVAEALQHAHDQGVLHRDITSRNVMVDADGRAVVVDFGLALDIDQTRLTMGRGQIGTAGYMSPEAIQGQQATPQTDLYGLGVILYELLTGRRPFTGDRLEQVLYATVNEPATAPSKVRAEVPPELDAVVRRLLEKRPADRFASASELSRILSTGSGREFSAKLESGDEAHPAGNLPPMRDARKRWLAASGVLTVLLAVSWMLTGRNVTEQGGFSQASVATLPLQNISPDKEPTNWLVEALGSDLVNKLSRIEGLRMRPWLSSARYDPSELELADIADQLNAEILITGHYRVIRDQVQVSIGLVAKAEGFQFWSEEFSGQLDEVFLLQERLARRVAAKLVPGRSDGEAVVDAKPVTRSIEAYEYYARGAREFRIGTPEAMDSAYQYFNKSLAIDPDLIEAHVGVGTIHLDHYYTAHSGGLDNLELAERHFTRALQIDPRLKSALLGLVKTDYHRSEYVRLLERVQDATWAHGSDIESLVLRAVAYTLGGMADRSIEIFERVIAQDPANQAAQWFLSFATLWAGDTEACLKESANYLRRFGSDPEVRLWRGMAFSSLENHRRAINELRVAQEEWGDENQAYICWWRGLVLMRAGKQEEAQRVWSRGISWAQARLARYPQNPRLATLLTITADRALDASKATELKQRWIAPSADQNSQISYRLAMLGGAYPAELTEAGFRQHLAHVGHPVQRELLSVLQGGEVAENPLSAQFAEESHEFGRQLRERIRF